MPGRCSWSISCSPAAERLLTPPRCHVRIPLFNEESCTEKKREQGNREMGERGEWEMANGNAEDAETGGKITWKVPIRRASVPSCSPVQEESSLRYGHNRLRLAESRNAQEWSRLMGEPLPPQKGVYSRQLPRQPAWCMCQASRRMPALCEWGFFGVDPGSVASISSRREVRGIIQPPNQWAITRLTVYSVNLNCVITAPSLRNATATNQLFSVFRAFKV